MVYLFDEFELDLAARSLTRAGQAIPVQPKVFALLHVLIRERRSVVLRDDLIRELWPAIQVSESALNRLIKEARRLVGDTGHRQRLIRTVRGAGYQFVGAVDASLPVAAERRHEEAIRRLVEARTTFEAALRRNAHDLHIQADEFVRTCQLALALASPIENGVRPE